MLFVTTFYKLIDCIHSDVCIFIKYIAIVIHDIITFNNFIFKFILYLYQTLTIYILLGALTPIKYKAVLIVSFTHLVKIRRALTLFSPSLSIILCSK